MCCRILSPTAEDEALRGEPIDVPTLVLCLKRLVKSVQKWNKHCGRQGISISCRNLWVDCPIADSSIL